MYNERIPDLTFENASIIFRNFAGKGSAFNREGDRNFSVILPDVDAAIALYNDGWNVAVRPQTKEDREAIKIGNNLLERIDILDKRGTLSEAIFHLKVTVNYNSRKTPDIYLIAGAKKRPVLLDENTVAQLDLADIYTTDIVISPYAWTSPRGSGVTAYLKTMYVTINADPFAEKYNFDDDELM